jgi:hypothetical protein
MNSPSETIDGIGWQVYPYTLVILLSDWCQSPLQGRGQEFVGYTLHIYYR